MATKRLIGPPRPAVRLPGVSTAGKVIDGKALAAELLAGLPSRVAALAKALGRPPGLGVVLVGDDPGSRVYVTMKRKATANLGIHSDEVVLPAQSSLATVLGAVRRYNDAPAIDAVLVQLPLPAPLDTLAVQEAVDPFKDVDGLHPRNMGLLAMGAPFVYPCTPHGVLRILESIGYDLSGKKVCIVGRSSLVGRPLALMLLSRNATVTICHSRTRVLATEVGAADVVIAAAGRPRLIRGAWLRPGAVVIDVGVNRLADGSLVGDVDFESALSRVRAITPVPGGVGPLTIAMLCENTVTLAEARAARQPPAPAGRANR